MESLINFDGLGDIVVNFTNKLSSGVGWIANRETPKKLAVNTIIEDIKASNLDPVTKAALINNAKKIIKEYCNQHDIVEIAISSLQVDAKPERIDNDWLEQFMDKARLVSSEEFKLIWGNILARECNCPGSIPRSLLHTLEEMDREDAEIFTTLCRMSIKLEKDYAPVVIASRFDEYKQFGLTFDGLVNLKALGLIEMDFGPLTDSAYLLAGENVSSKVVYFDMEYELYGQNSVPVGNVIFTKTGEALIQAITVDKIDGFWEKYCLPFWQNNCKANGNKLAEKDS